MKAQTSAEYSNGATAEAGAWRRLSKTAYCPSPPNTARQASNKASNGVGVIQSHGMDNPQGTAKMMLAAITCVVVFSVRPRMRTKMLVQPQAKAAKSASMAGTSATPEPGLAARMTPASPQSTAIQRAPVTFSLRMTVERMTTKSGAAKYSVTSSASPRLRA